MPPSPAPELLHAHALLGETLDDPVPRARRIAGLYAALYLEDPLLHQWGGVAAFVARHVHYAMEAANGVFERFTARGNLDIYEATMPAFLRLRSGQPAVGPLAPGMDLLRVADQQARHDLAAAVRTADDGLLALTRVEQEQIVQPAYDLLGGVEAATLRPLMRFRMGMADDAPLFAFDGDDGRDPAQRVAWALEEVLPAWRRFHGAHPDLCRAELDRLRRWAGVGLLSGG